MKKQIVTFQKESISSLADMKSDIRQKMSDSDISYTLDVESLTNTGYNWNLAENKMTMTRTWQDEDYDSYIVNWSDSKKETVTKLEADGYTFTEVIDSA